MQPALLGIAVLLTACGAASVAPTPGVDAGAVGDDLASTVDSPGAEVAASVDGAGAIGDDVPEARDDAGTHRPDGGPDGCGPGQTRCGTACVDLSGDDRNCGACGRVCATTLVHGRPFCRDRGGHAGPACEEGCAPGWRDCNHDHADGCETETPDGGGCLPRGQ